MADVNYQQVTNTVGQASANAEANLGSFMKTMDANSTSDLIKLQNMTQQWSMMVGLNSNLSKTVGDALKAMVQNIR